MPAMVDNMVYNGEAPWHKIGVQIPRFTSALDALRMAEMDWVVQKRPLFTVGKSGTVSAPGYVALVREKDDAVLGVTSPRYEPLQNTEVADVVQGILDTGRASIETAGSLRNGKIVWFLMDLSVNDEVVSSDSVKLYAIVSNGHDGKRAVKLGYTPVRVVCSNTLAASESHLETRTIRVLHRGNVLESVQAIADSMDLATAGFSATIDSYRKMASKSINKADLKKYIESSLNLKEDQSTRARNIISLVEWKAENGIGNQQVAGTVWGAYNAITEYLSHNAARNLDNRYSNLWFGSAQNINERAFELAKEIAA